MHTKINEWLYRHGYITVSEHEKVIRMKNKTIQDMMHTLIEQEREINRLNDGITVIHES